LKKSLLALSLGLTAGLAGTSAFANTGNILFEGKITNSTCPIEIVNPENGLPGNHVNMGTVHTSSFGGANQEQPGKGFLLRVRGDGGCTIAPGESAKVTFNGNPDTTNTYFAVTGGATGVVITLKDRTGANLAPGTASAEYPLTPGEVTDMRFDALYRSTVASPVAGAVSADISFVVAIN
jgi:type 1 fimbria pilin